MGAGRQHVYSTNLVVAANESAANTETVVASLAGVTAEFPQQVVQLLGLVVTTPAAGATAMSVVIRRDSLTGAVVGVGDTHAGDIQPSKLSGLSIVKFDTGREVAGATYVMTILGAGEAGAASISAVSLIAIVN